MTYELKGKSVWVAGHRGMVGSALVRRLASEGCEIITAGREQLDLTRQAEVETFIAATRPHAVIIAAARVGGILANATQPAPFLSENLLIQTNILNAAHSNGVEKLLLLGSSCIYPRLADQPIREESLLSGPLEPTNEAYAIAKIAGIKLAQAYRRQYGHDFISAMPANLYGPGDNFDPLSSHVIPALIRRAHEARISRASKLTLWGTGTPRRELLHVDDCADALVFLLKTYSAEAPINVGSGEDHTISDIARMICRTVGFNGSIVQDPGKPDGTPRKLMNSDRLRAMGWMPRIGLETGLAATYSWFLQHNAACAA